MRAMKKSLSLRSLPKVDPWILETASDNRYVTVSGDDNLPDMIIGRLPVTTEIETSAAVSKIIDHYTYFNRKLD